MGDGLDEELHGGKVGATKFTLPVQFGGTVCLSSGEIAVHLVEEGSAASWQQIVSRRVLDGVTINDDARSSWDNLYEVAEHLRVRGASEGAPSL